MRAALSARHTEAREQAFGRRRDHGRWSPQPTRVRP